jgi:hypothetical protein
MSSSRSSGNEVDIEYLRSLYDSKDWEATLTCCLKTLLLENVKLLRRKRSVHYIA